MDDPDEFVYNEVSNRIFSYGKEIIPHLENFWENSPDNFTQERIELLIHRLHFSQLEGEIKEWKKDPSDLFKGGVIISKFHYPDLDEAPVYKQFERIRKNLWLELNPYQTSLETIHVINSILYNFYQFKGVEISHDSPEYFLPVHAINNRKANVFALGIIYQSLCNVLDVSIKAISIPRQYILAYFNSLNFDLNADGAVPDQPNYYIDASGGQIYSLNDIQNYFSKIKKPMESGFQPLTNTAIIINLMRQLSSCYNTPQSAYKAENLQKLIQLLEEGEEEK